MGQDKILVVEDEVIVARTITRQLSQLGYMVTGTASSGEVAIAKALETHPELVLMDIILKGDMDGITAAGYIREQLDIPVIFITAYGDDHTLERAQVTQPFGYIIKPFTIKDLRIAIEIALSRHKLERALRDSRNQLATVLNSMSDGVIATNERGLITFINPSAQRLTGWQEEEALEQNVSDILRLFDDVTQTDIENPFTKLIKQEEAPELGEFTSLIHKSGRKIPIGHNFAPLKRGSYELIGAVIVFWDISERRHREFLEEALHKEQELNRLKSLFISTVSHEFRNPLTVIQTAVELIDIQGTKLTVTRRNTYLKRIYGAVQYMEKLLEDVLFMGRAEAGKLMFNPVFINLEQFCRELVEEFRTLNHHHHEIIFTSNCQQTDAPVDERLLHYLLRNLLNNALKYSPHGGRIEFNLSCDLAEGFVTFQVKDQGIGIPETEQAQVFDSFYRGSNVKSIQGNGLGLVIVKRCVEAHRGVIEMMSQEGVGTTFTVKLPLYLPSEPN
ncbi:multi-sensor signal transduction histidine kinase [Richelia sinica FACHB-800]|uniref:histidine kinase n=1 Tax=Richelia sinica FACHB-800 TaxID=1357546 RepID=A0A975T838_9NOST|nr:hybrid sensor histidine kinase/response regulator [Richelia sinica]MBD2666246.1 response regulator [Richelia sinica FACHB-800]QXE23854.1 multi-sensor signal transduction histidine kinase [Richelia sinica FACHB-800]